MGEAELRSDSLIIRSVFYFYGDAANEELATQIAHDIQSHWNEPDARCLIRGRSRQIRFEIQGIHEPDIDPEKIWYNDNPQLNFFRIEPEVMGNISFVDGIGSNTGYFKLGDIIQTSTSAAHEYGHTLGLVHPENLDIRGMPLPTIMYPRGTICDPHFQYDPTAAPAAYGGCLNPAFRKVTVSDIELLKLHTLSFSASQRAIVGAFSSIFHAKHLPADFVQ